MGNIIAGFIYKKNNAVKKGAVKSEALKNEVKSMDPLSTTLYKASFFTATLFTLFHSSMPKLIKSGAVKISALTNEVLNAVLKIVRKRPYTRSTLKELYLHVKVGDLIQIIKDPHWLVVVEVGQDEATVIHFLREGVLKNKLEDMVEEGEECRINNSYDAWSKTKEGFVVNSPEETVKRATHYYQHPEEFGTYHHKNNCCSHFAVGCRNRTTGWQQVERK